MMGEGNIRIVFPADFNDLIEWHMKFIIKINNYIFVCNIYIGLPWQAKPIICKLQLRFYFETLKIHTWHMYTYSPAFNTLSPQILGQSLDQPIFFKTKRPLQNHQNQRLPCSKGNPLFRFRMWGFVHPLRLPSCNKHLHILNLNNGFPLLQGNLWFW